MCAHLYHPDNNKIGKLPDDIPESSFLVDPSHRIKVMCKELFKLSLAIKQSSDCELIDVVIFKENI